MRRLLALFRRPVAPLPIDDPDRLLRTYRETLAGVRDICRAA